MVTNLKEHLENIRIFTDFKKSGLATIDDFWDSFNKTPLRDKLEFYNVDHKEANKCPLPDKKSEENIDIGQNQIADRDSCEEYVRWVQDSIEEAIDKNQVRLPDKFPLGDIYEEIIMRCGNIEKFLGTTEKFVHEYTTLAKGMAAKDFFTFLAKQHKGEMQVKFVKKTVEVLSKNPHPRIFKDLKAFLFFESWVSEKKSDSDISYIFRRMKEDKLIHKYIGENEFIDFLLAKNYIMAGPSKLKSLHTISDKGRKPRYEELKQLYFSK